SGLRRLDRLARLAGRELRLGVRGDALAESLGDSAAALLVEGYVHLPGAVEDALRGGELLLAAGILDPLERARFAVLDRDLRDPQLAPLPDAEGSVDRDRHHGRAGLEGHAAEAGLGLAEPAGPRASTLRVDEDRAAVVEDRVRGPERLLVVMAAADRERAARPQDPRQHAAVPE